jgi:hypothetical protein
LALTSPTSGGRLVGIVRLRTKATEFSFSLFNEMKYQLNTLQSWSIPLFTKTNANKNMSIGANVLRLTKEFFLYR